MNAKTQTPPGSTQTSGLIGISGVNTLADSRPEANSSRQSIHADSCSENRPPESNFLAAFRDWQEPNYEDYDSFQRANFQTKTPSQINKGTVYDHQVNCHQPYHYQSNNHLVDYPQGIYHQPYDQVHYQEPGNPQQNNGSINCPELTNKQNNQVSSYQQLKNAEPNNQLVQGPELDSQRTSRIQSNNQESTSSLGAASDATADCETVRLNRLEKVLHTFGEGRAIYRHFHHHGKLNEETRQILVQIIIQSEIDEACRGLSVKGPDQLQEFSISKNRFTEYSEQIEKLFPPDLKEIYYTPFYSNNGERVLAGGRLWNHYNYAKGCMREHGLLHKKSDKVNSTPAVNHTDDISEKLEWLRNFAESFQKVTDYWRETFSARQHMLLVLKTEVFSYFSEFLPLRLQDGLHLVNSDFEALHPGKALLFTERWPIGAEKLLQRLQGIKNIRSVDDKALVKVLPHLDTDTRAAVIFHLLPYLIPAERQGRKRTSAGKENDNSATRSAKRTNSKAISAVGTSTGEISTNLQSSAIVQTGKSSLIDRRESFTIIVPTAADIEVELERKRHELRKRGETLQPTPVIVGTVTDIISTHVVVNDIIYKKDSYIRAIDLCFKIFYAVNCELPYGSKNIWKFIQKAFFQIESSSDRFSPSVTALSGELWAAFK